MVKVLELGEFAASVELPARPQVEIGISKSKATRKIQLRDGEVSFSIEAGPDHF
jgi:hypothetical protein